jgi:GNAT superfamily N-acetyltransferase
MPLALEYHPVTSDRRADLARFSEAHGKFHYCSCMRWRMTSAEYKRSTKESRVATLDGLAAEDVPVGVLAYLDGEPVGWVAVAPRVALGALERFKALARIDEQPVWSVSCFFLDRRIRGQGARLGLLNAAVAFALEQGARIVEGYPVEPGKLYGYMGAPDIFRAADFVDVTPPGRERQIWRYTVAAMQDSAGG